MELTNMINEKKSKFLVTIIKKQIYPYQARKK